MDLLIIVNPDKCYIRENGLDKKAVEAALFRISRLVDESISLRSTLVYVLPLGADQKSAYDLAITFGKPIIYTRTPGVPYLESRLLGDYENIVVVGFATDKGVVANALALQALFSHSKITVYSNCCVGTSKEGHTAALKILQTCGIEVIQY